jgi:transposase
MKQGIREKNITSNKNKYDAEFREQVVEVYNSGAYETVAECANSYGIKESTLHTWISKSKKAVEVSKDPEYVNLKKENIRLKMELEILKKATIYFASHAK